MKVLDVNRGRVVEARTFRVNNETSNACMGAGGLGPGFGLVGSIQSLNGTPMEAIVRDILTQVASFTSTRMLNARQVAVGKGLAVAQTMRRRRRTANLSPAEMRLTRKAL